MRNYDRYKAFGGVAFSCLGEVIGCDIFLGQKVELIITDSSERRLLNEFGGSDVVFDALGFVLKGDDFLFTAKISKFFKFEEGRKRYFALELNYTCFESSFEVFLQSMYKDFERFLRRHKIHWRDPEKERDITATTKAKGILGHFLSAIREAEIATALW